MFKEVYVKYDDLNIFHAYIDTEAPLWNGYLCPYFEAAVIPQIKVAYNIAGRHDELFMDFIDDVVLLNSPDDKPERIEPIKITVENGKEKMVWPIGAGAWCWCLSEVPVYETPQQYVRALSLSNVEYHYDDHPYEVVWSTPLSETELNVLIYNHSRLWFDCKEQNKTPWDFGEKLPKWIASCDTSVYDIKDGKIDSQTEQSGLLRLRQHDDNFLALESSTTLHDKYGQRHVLNTALLDRKNTLSLIGQLQELYHDLEDMPQVVNNES